MSKIKLKWSDFLDENKKIAINCETEDEANELLTQLNEKVKRWESGDSLLEFNDWEIYEKETCYTAKVCYADIDFYELNGYTIYKFKNIEFVDDTGLTTEEKRDEIVRQCCSYECDVCKLKKSHIGCLTYMPTGKKEYQAAIDDAYDLVCKNSEQENVEKVSQQSKPEPKKDNVNHPSHYNQGGIECIDAMVSAFGEEAVKDFCICNAFKYIFRFKLKNGIEDIDKSIWYLNKYKELENNE